MEKDPIDVVRYLVYKCSFYGDLITNLKMQKLLYYVYVWCLVREGEVCFKHKFQAWPNGPVLPVVYRKLKQFGAAPIDPGFADLETKKDLKELKDILGDDLTLIIDKVYEKYGTKSAFELVALTHSEAPWKNAIQKEGRKEIEDKDILETYGKPRG
jgi:uncharacterized phage-associated protein